MMLEIAKYQIVVLVILSIMFLFQLFFSYLSCMRDIPKFNPIGHFLIPMTFSSIILSMLCLLSLKPLSFFLISWSLFLAITPVIPYLYFKIFKK